MPILSLIRRFVPPYRGQMMLSIFFNLLSTVLSLFSFAAIIPVLRILFGLTTAEAVPVDLAATVGLQEFVAGLRTNLYCMMLDHELHNQRNIAEHLPGLLFHQLAVKV